MLVGVQPHELDPRLKFQPPHQRIGSGAATAHGDRAPRHENGQAVVPPRSSEHATQACLVARIARYEHLVGRHRARGGADTEAHRTVSVSVNGVRQREVPSVGVRAFLGVRARDRGIVGEALTIEASRLITANTARRSTAVKHRCDRNERAEHGENENERRTRHESDHHGPDDGGHDGDDGDGDAGGRTR